MRPFCVIGLFAAVAALAGCGSSPTTPASRPAPIFTQDELTAHAGRFRDDPQSNRPDAGEKLPLKYTDINGSEVDLASFRGKSHVVLVIVKGFTDSQYGPFCPGCLGQVNALTAKYDQFKAKGAEVLMLFPGPTAELGNFLAEGKVDGSGGNPRVPFRLLSDTGLKAVKSLGIDAIKQAVPATYIIDKKGNVVFAYVADLGDTTHDRPSVKALLAQLDKLNDQK